LATTAAVISSAKGERRMSRKSSAATYALDIPPAHGREKKMLTSGARLSLRGECKYMEMYVFVHACSWARVIFIRIPWRI
jgi:hypothetical protein